VVVKKPTDKNTKVEILQAYEELAKEKAALKSELEKVAKENQSGTKEEPKLEQKIVMNQLSSVQQKMNNTIESLAKIQLGFGSAANELSEQLTTKASQLEEIRRTLEEEIQQLTQLHNLEVSDDILDTLIQAYEDNTKAYHEEYRQRDASEYKYNLELRRQLQSDEYEQEQKALYKQLEELLQGTEKQWAEREKAISEREKQFEELKAKVEAFPKDKEAAIKKATEEGKGIAHYQAKIKSDLYSKEVEGQKRFYEQRLQSLEQTITNQETRIQNLSQQLESALKQVQDLAVKAIEGNSNVNSYQAIKEIALEQAKTQAKNK
jgi:uncharacterized coiled-coil protein SlyX